MGLQDCTLNLNRAGRELQPHGTPDFPCAGYSSTYTDSAGDVIPWHWHDDLELIYIESGYMKLQVPGKTFHLTQGEGAAINSNILHFAAAEPYCELHSLVFHPMLVTGSENSIFANKYITPLLNCNSFDGCLLNQISTDILCCPQEFDEAFKAFRLETPGYEFIVREKLSHICLALHQNYEHEIDLGDTESDPDSIRIQQMLDYIHSHYHENLELSRIAKAADIGERECLRCFKRVIQTSPMQYLLKYRTAQGASILLKNPNASVSHIASICGFNSPSNFSQMFKRYFNCTPREYRKNSGQSHNATSP